MDPLQTATLLAGCCTIAGCGCAAVDPGMFCLTAGNDPATYQYSMATRADNIAAPTGLSATFFRVLSVMGCLNEAEGTGRGVHDEPPEMEEENNHFCNSQCYSFGGDLPVFEGVGGTKMMGRTSLRASREMWDATSHAHHMLYNGNSYHSSYDTTSSFPLDEVDQGESDDYSIYSGQNSENVCSSYCRNTRPRCHTSHVAQNTPATVEYDCSDADKVLWRMSSKLQTDATWRDLVRAQGQWQHADAYLEDATERIQRRQHTSPTTAMGNQERLEHEPLSAFYLRKAYAESLQQKQAKYKMRHQNMSSLTNLSDDMSTSTG